MTNIDFSRVMTLEAKEAAEAEQRAKAIKSACGARIRQAISESAQTNISQAVATYTAERVRGATETHAETASGLSDADFPLVAAGRGWIAAMQAECRRAIADGDDPVWPDLPAGVADLVARF